MPPAERWDILTGCRQKMRHLDGTRASQLHMYTKKQMPPAKGGQHAKHQQKCMQHNTSKV